MELFLAQLLGIYFLVVGIVVLLRQNSMMPTVKELAANRPLLMIMAFIELAAGLATILAFPQVAFSVSGIIGLAGWMMVVESIIYLALPAKNVQKFIAHFNKKEFYLGGGILSVGVGLYLVGVSFGFIA